MKCQFTIERVNGITNHSDFFEIKRTVRIVRVVMSSPINSKITDCLSRILVKGETKFVEGYINIDDVDVNEFVSDTNDFVFELKKDCKINVTLFY